MSETPPLSQYEIEHSVQPEHDLDLHHEETLDPTLWNIEEARSEVLRIVSPEETEEHSIATADPEADHPVVVKLGRTIHRADVLTQMRLLRQRETEEPKAA